MLSKETFHPLEDMNSVLLMEGQVNIVLGFFFLERIVLGCSLNRDRNAH